MLKKLVLFYLILLFNTISFAGGKGEPKSDFGFPLDSLENMLARGINKMRLKSFVDTLAENPILEKASELQAVYSAKNGRAEVASNGGTAKRIIKSGGAGKGEEIVVAAMVAKGKGNLKYTDIGVTILKKWQDSKKDRPILVNGKYVYYGITARLAEDGKKIFISIVLGGYDIYNDGAKKRGELKAPFSSKAKKMKPYTVTACKSCEKFKDYDSLRNGLYVKDDKIFLKYHSLKAVQRILKRPNDALAVDIVQREQYDKPAYNILNNNLLTKGICTKPMSGPKIISKNLHQKNKAREIKDKNQKVVKKVQALDVPLGKFPSNVKGEYELNLLVIQNGKLCKTITRSYIEKGKQQGSPFDMLLMPDSSAYLKPLFEPKSESSLLPFTVPFEKNKFDYKEEDMKPFLDALQEPDFFIEGIYITAYSSIEGDSVSNARLQKNRANSIIEALKKFPQKEAMTNIRTSDSWNLFTMEMEDSEFDYLTKMKKKQAIREINSKPDLLEKLEPTLSKERFAQIILDVTYDIAGPKEERFCISKFNSAVKKNDIKQAMKIQYLIDKNIASGKYAYDSYTKMQIPNEAKYSGLLMNNVVYDYFRNNHTPTLEHYKRLKELESLDPANSYVKYNRLFCVVKSDSSLEGNSSGKNGTQDEIDALYKSDIPKRLVDDLNTEYQFKLMAAIDTIEEQNDKTQKAMEACIDKIKSFYNIKDASWQNSLKLAYMFMRHNEFKYSATLLEPFLTLPDVTEDVIFAYVSAAAHSQDKMNSHFFTDALKKAHELNHDRYCELFGEPYLTFQLMDNPNVKADYLKNNCK